MESRSGKARMPSSYKIPTLEDMIYHIPSHLKQDPDKYAYTKIWTNRLRYMAPLCEPYFKEGCALDIGAHWGFYSQWLCRHFETVYAFEPLPANWQLLNRNASQAHIMPIGVGDTGLYAIKRPWSMIGEMYDRKDAPDDHLPVLSISLDDYNWGKIGFMKIDVEGMEKQVLVGAQNILAHQKPPILIEVKTWDPMEYLAEYGYKLIQRHEIDALYV